MNRLMTGYFATETSRSKVHIVRENHRSACGRHFKGQFQWCANFVHIQYVDCPKCQQWYEKHLRNELIKALR